MGLVIALLSHKYSYWPYSGALEFPGVSLRVLINQFYSVLSAFPGEQERRGNWKIVLLFKFIEIELGVAPFVYV